MSIISLKARILLGAALWTVGLFTIAAFILHFVLPPPSAHGVFRLAFRYGTGMALIAALSMLFGFLQVRRGLSPINQLRDRLTAVHKGVAARVSVAVSAEGLVCALWQLSVRSHYRMFATEPPFYFSVA